MSKVTPNTVEEVFINSVVGQHVSMVFNNNSDGCNAILLVEHFVKNGVLRFIAGKPRDFQITVARNILCSRQDIKEMGVHLSPGLKSIQDRPIPRARLVLDLENGVWIFRCTGGNKMLRSAFKGFTSNAHNCAVEAVLSGDLSIPGTRVAMILRGPDDGILLFAETVALFLNVDLEM